MTKLLSKMPLIQLVTPVLITVFASAGFAQSPPSTPREQKLLNGLKLLMFDAPASDKVTLKVRIHAGSAFDPQGKEGLMKLLAAHIFPNAEAKEFFSEQLGGSLEINSNYDYIQIDASSKPDGLLAMLETVSGAIVNAEINKEITNRIKAQHLQRVAELSKDPSYVADMAAASRLLGTFPYGRPESGTQASLEKIDFADVIGAKQRFLTADNATVVLAGKFDQALAFRAVRRFFGAWLKSDKLVPATFRQPDEPPTGVLSLELPATGSFEARFATRGTSRSSADAVAYRIAASIIESRLKSTNQGSISILSSEHILPGLLLIRFSGANSEAGPKIEATEMVIKALAAPVTESEFQRAKQLVMSELNGRDILDRWLDVDTFKTDTPAKVQGKANATALADVQTVISRIQKQPLAVVVGIPAKSAN